MKANFETALKKQAIAKVAKFNGFNPRKIAVVSNSSAYPQSVTFSYEVYCGDYDGFVLCDCVTGNHYAMTMQEVSAALQSMIDGKKCWKPRSSSADLLRLTFSDIETYKF